MKDPRLDAQVLGKALLDRRWAALARSGVDLAGIATWDKLLDRRTRLLVPIDVQAFVVPAAGGEATVPIGGGKDDPAPFTEGTPRPAGVHLHWALPDALLRAKARAPVAESAGGLTFAALPPRWVVIRALLPVGRAAALVRGWVIDAPTGSVTPLLDYAGIPAPAPAGTPVLSPLDAAAGGSLLWTASYTASAGRFAFHDPLTDLPAPGSATAPSGIDGNQAVYVVAGWWPELGEDPLAGVSGPRRLDARLAELGWLVVHDGDDSVTEPEDPRLERQRSDVGLSSPAPQPQVHMPAADGKLARVSARLGIEAALPVAGAKAVVLGPTLPHYATLLHGAVLGVPVGGPLPAGADDRPLSSQLSVALGADVDDVVSAFGAGALGVAPAQREFAERLTAAFTSDLLDRLGSADGIADLEEHEHGDGFASLPGSALSASRPDRLRAEDAAPAGPTSVGRKARARSSSRGASERKTKLSWKGLDLTSKSSADTAPASKRNDEQPLTPAADAREVKRPAPRWFYPQPPTLAIRGARPSHRHHGDGLYDDTGRLRCRYPKECVPGWQGVLDGATAVPSIGSGAVPDEVLRVVREAVLLNPYAQNWLARAGGSGGPTLGAVQTRLGAEMLRLYGADARYDGSSHVPSAFGRAASRTWVSQKDTLADRQVAAELAKFSLLPGTPPSPVAITTWRQPWVPLWLEWRVVLEGGATLDGWRLGSIDFEPDAPATDQSLEFVGRSPIGQGLSTALRRGILRWLEAEEQRDATGGSILSDADELALSSLGDFVAPLDLVSASLDGIREQLLGIPFIGNAAHASDGKVLATGTPVPLFGGTLRIAELRLVDAFGRVLPVPAESVATTTTLSVPGVTNGMRVRPRLQHRARWLFRLVDPALPANDDPVSAREAFVDQLEPALAVNPVVGFLLPDHIDEALEVFDLAGAPLGQLAHDGVSGGVTWEPAPGRPLPPDAGPLAGLDAHTRIAGELAAGLVRADVAGRGALAPPTESALSALLRAIDTTLWTVDTFAALGSSSVAGLVGRPIAVVRATLRLEAPDDLDGVSLSGSATADARREAFAALAELRFPVQLGTLHRSDDALLGFFVDDDYEHLHLVDRVVASRARESGRHRGHLGLLGENAAPAVDALDHPYLIEEDVLWIRCGQTLRLTLLMLPAGKVHLTSGILPRKALSLANEWVERALGKLVPSVRVGPVLVDPSEIRLPLVHLLGDKQVFTRRTGPLTWRDDPILAATQTALLPRTPHEVQEGWIRVAPDDSEGDR